MNHQEIKMKQKMQLGGETMKPETQNYPVCNRCHQANLQGLDQRKHCCGPKIKQNIYI